MSQSRNPAINETQLNPSTVSDQIVGSRGSINQPLLDQSATSSVAPSVVVNNNTKAYKKYKLSIGISAGCLILFLIIGIAGPFILEAVINSLIGKQTILGKDNIGVWAQLPGDSGTDFVREFTFFNFSNWEDFVLHGSKPQFTQISGYQVSQIQDYINITWKDNDEVVAVNSWTRFSQKSNSRNLDEDVYIINPGPLGFWDTIKNSEPNLVLNQGIGISFLNTQSLIKNTVVGMTISSQFLPDFETAVAYLFEPADIDDQNAVFIWNDVSHGMSQSGTLNEWIVASEKGPTSIQAQDLGNYFTLSSSQLSSLMLSFIQITQAANQLVLSNYYCFGSNSCSGLDLTVKQMASMQVTNNPPPSKTILPNPSICNLNISCKNYFIELSSYYTFEFSKQHTEQQYQNLTFSEDVVKTWFYHDGDNVNTNQSSLLHSGNLKALWDNGTNYENNSDEQSLENIKSRFNLATKAHAFVFWNWIKYFYYQYINRGRQGGSVDKTGAALYGTQFFYKSWANTLDRLHILLLKYKLKDTFSNTSTFEFFSQSMRLPNNTIDLLAQNYDIHSLDSIEKLILTCRYKYHTEWDQMAQIINDDIAMEQFCDRTENDGFGKAYEQAEIYLDTYYNCDQTPMKYCSDYQLAVKQWASSNITKNPIPQMQSDYEASTTIHSWFDDIKPFEYGHWATKFSKETIPSINTSQAYRLMNHESLWSLNTWQQIWLETDPQQLIDRYGIYHQQIMGRYIRYVVVFVTFDGFAKSRKVRDLLFGYSDDLVEYIRQRSPLIGGDPSRPAILHLNDLNLTQQQAQDYPLELHTGKNHPDRTAYIKSTNGKGTINFNTSQWNGNETIDFTESPWAEEIPIIGTDGKQSYPKQHEQPFNISIFVPAAQRTVLANFTGETAEKFGLKVNKFEIGKSFFESSSQNPDNAKYYQTLPGFINLTKLYSFPLYASQNHFYKLDSNWTQLIQFWNENHTSQQSASKHDDSFFYIQPYSGVTFQANVFLMLSYYYQPDFIFQTPNARMLPIFNVLQSGNFTKSGADKLLGSLRSGLSAKKVVFWIGIILSILLAITLVALIVLYKKRIVYDKKKQSLIEIQEDIV